MDPSKSCGLSTSTVEGVALIQQGLSLITCFAVWVMVHRVYGTRGAMVAGLALALSPFRHYYAQALLSDSLAELFLVGGVCLLVLSMGAPLHRMIALRAFTGLALGATTLVRANLAPAMILAGMAPAGHPHGESRRLRLVAGVLITTLAWVCVYFPWAKFNAARGIRGITGGQGYQITIWANEHGIGEPVDLKNVELTPQLDRDLQHAVWERFRTHPVSYAKAVLVSAHALFVPIPPTGDVAPSIARCQASPVKLPVFNQSPPPLDGAWRRTIHHNLWRIYAHLLVPLGWIGLTAWGLTAVVARRFDLAIVSAAPLTCVIALSVILQANTRYAFPCEALALAFGLPAFALLRSGRALRE